jgi:hypothetical protein
MISVSETLRRWQRVFRTSKDYNKSTTNASQSTPATVAGGLSKDLCDSHSVELKFLGQRELMLKASDPFFLDASPQLIWSRTLTKVTIQRFRRTLYFQQQTQIGSRPEYAKAYRRVETSLSLTVSVVLIKNRARSKIPVGRIILCLQ